MVYFKVPNQQFHISLKAKKIYDITERKVQVFEFVSHDIHEIYGCLSEM